MENEKCSYGTNKIQFHRKYFWPVKVYMWEVEDASVGKVLALLEMRQYERSQKWHCVVVYAYDLAP